VQESCDVVPVHCVLNLGTHAKKKEFRAWPVTNPVHPQPEKFERVLNDRELRDPMANLGSVMESRCAHLQPR
jgi:hypothetical protein